MRTLNEVNKEIMNLEDKRRDFMHEVFKKRHELKREREAIKQQELPWRFRTPTKQERIEEIERQLAILKSEV